MPNPYHDETGRFCSKTAMKSAINRLAKAGETQAAFALVNDYNKINAQRQQESFVSKMLTSNKRLQQPTPIEGVGSEDHLGVIGTGNRSPITALSYYFSSSYRHSENVKHSAQMFFVHADDYREELYERRAGWENIQTEKAVYYAMLKETQTMMETFENNKNVSDGDIDKYFERRATSDTAKTKAERNQQTINRLAIKKLQESLANSYDDERWDKYPKIADSISARRIGAVRHTR